MKHIGNGYYAVDIGRLSYKLVWLKVTFIWWSQPSVRQQQPNCFPSLQCRGHRGTGLSLSGLHGWNQHSSVMQSMCATDTAYVIISVIQFYQPPPERKGGCEGGESSHLGDTTRCWAKINLTQFVLMGNQQDNFCRISSLLSPLARVLLDSVYELATFNLMWLNWPLDLCSTERPPGAGTVVQLAKCPLQKH